MFEIRSRAGRVVLQIVATILVLPYLFPLIVMVKGAFAGEGVGNFRAVLGVPGFARFFLNSVIIAVAVIVLVYAVTMMAAFGFAKLHIRFREV